MCLGSSPSYTPPAPVAPPPPPQREQAPAMQNPAATGSKGTSRAGGAKVGSLLTGPTGIDNKQLNVGKTLLGQ